MLLVALSAHADSTDADDCTRIENDSQRLKCYDNLFKRAVADATVEITDTLRSGHITLPNGHGLEYPDASGERVVHGVAPNELTASEDRDFLAGTPWHKSIPARIEAVG